MAEGGSQCCCGKCSVRAGTIVIAIIWLICNGLHIAAYVCNLCWLSDSNNGNPFKSWWTAWDEAMAKTGVNKYDEIPVVEKMRDLVEEIYRDHRVCLAIYSYLALVGGVLQVGFSKLLLFAAIKNDPRPCFRYIVFSWLLFNLIGLLVGIAAVVPLVVYTGIYLGVGLCVGLAVEYFIVFALCIYLLYVVGMYWNEMGEGGCDGGGAQEAGAKDGEADAEGLLKKE